MSPIGRLLAAAAGASLAACGGGGPSGEPPTREIDAAAYVALLAPFLPSPSDDGARPVVFVAPLDGETLALEVQIEVVDAYADTHDLRFVDEPAAALDHEAGSRPPLEEGVLVGIGPLSADEPHTAQVEIYRRRDTIDAHLVTLTFFDGGWRVSGQEPVEPGKGLSAGD